MARLSEEHFKSNTSTPARKPSRFKEIFRHRPSTSSNSTSPNTLTSSAPIASPLASPKMRLGFEKVGLLPSERTSLDAAKRELENNGGSAVSEAMEMEVHELSGEIAPHNLETGLNISGTTHADEVAEMTGNQKRGKEEQGFEQSFEKFLKQRKEHTVGDHSMAEGSSSQILEPATTETTIAGDKQRKSASVGSEKNQFEAVAQPDDTFKSSNDHSDSHMAFPSDMLNADNPLSRGIREYVSSEVAAALVAHERKQVYQLPKTVDAPGHITFNLDISGLAKSARLNVVKITENKLSILDGPKSIGPLTIAHSRIACDIQLSVIAIYLTFTLGAAFLGPKTLLLTLWRIGVVLTVYAVVIRRLDWKDDSHSDLILSPVCYFGREVQIFSGEMAKDLAETFFQLSGIAVTDIDGHQKEK
ncbi:uncharacterized protein K460DRAFT_271677 [Cucurbitaria berberidis CBS 394.84]|uniref:Uncharacterized protein n=1 Tax=Cucurbitaria berberidis CBS 394.84 TaxID=1168544 RepID=A0A9P4GQU2_9PLEO|nr:uncharacterized protein K460DRAFT_271677 [Cucurbitaria berberidis CBS 394.84]KAF1850097.1 hypothetical protein K460DRAFT_271677 [Cucurbitaria berberidis CBS 394.84]